MIFTMILTSGTPMRRTPMPGGSRRRRPRKTVTSSI